jgi:hypothetical protein
VEITYGSGRPVELILTVVLCGIVIWEKSYPVRSGVGRQSRF